MLTPERHNKILEMLAEKEVVPIQELVEATDASESTIRRDLSELQKRKKLKRVHGGAELFYQKGEEPSVAQKSSKHLPEKERIAEYAAGFVNEDDRIFLDAGTTTLQMIKHLAGKNIMVVTNGITHLEELQKYEIPVYLTGGFVKYKTKALIGSNALESLNSYRFDACFMGVNGIQEESGYTTPDPEEAAVKRLAIELSQKAYVLADSSKHDKAAFAKIAALEEAVLITDRIESGLLNQYLEKTDVKVVE
ncbi:DeoR/GlpR family DNA-binding transcription regulator [Metabacillus sp. GX 13764]|uniref:DeoR/GlpR family DNA-binding transcription regulator n=1 Tax=Metabacillus kandeliae TaxID=2900151 RepID=UPI001E2848C1|nr:DeoR/GlpR family DNA-binding transcription regulator [Metabacillus kandeliae]MCD7032738.1 DeoR/GlpR family DNA-binding transcription regulator [Metabacillus kandeliae]